MFKNIIVLQNRPLRNEPVFVFKRVGKLKVGKRNGSIVMESFSF